MRFFLRVKQSTVLDTKPFLGGVQKRQPTLAQRTKNSHGCDLVEQVFGPWTLEGGGVNHNGRCTGFYKGIDQTFS